MHIFFHTRSNWKRKIDMPIKNGTHYVIKITCYRGSISSPHILVLIFCGNDDAFLLLSPSSIKMNMTTKRPINRQIRMRHYRIGTPASYGFAGQNGRALIDDVMDVMLSIVANQPISDHVCSSKDMQKDFPFLAHPYSLSETQPPLNPEAQKRKQ